MSWPKTSMFFLLSIFVFGFASAQRPHGLNVSTIIELAELDRYEMAAWANNQGLWAQIVHKGDIQIRHWVPENAPEQGEEEFGLSACEGIYSIRGGFGSFWMTCEEKYLQDFIQEALDLGFKRKSTGQLLNQDLENNSGYGSYFFFAPPSQGKQPDSGIHIAVCNGWMELKCIP